jgi:hypothetical protein
MAYRGFFAFFAGVGIAGAALAVSMDAASARSGGGGAAAPVAAGAPAARGGVASAQAMMRPHGGGGFRHRGRFGGTYWPGGYGDLGYGYSPYGEPPVDNSAPVSADIRNTYTYDVPWDWAHRYPPNVVPSDKPYVSSCPTESVSVPGRGGGDHTVNITRCY